MGSICQLQFVECSHTPRSVLGSLDMSLTCSHHNSRQSPTKSNKSKRKASFLCPLCSKIENKLRVCGKSVFKSSTREKGLNWLLWHHSSTRHII
jgi:hypothetical protein